MFRERIEGERSKIQNRAKRNRENPIKTKIISELSKELIGYRRDTIRKKLERAVRVYEIFRGIGGKSKVGRMKNTGITTIRNLRREEVRELINEINNIEDRRRNEIENEMDVDEWKDR